MRGVLPQPTRSETILKKADPRQEEMAGMISADEFRTRMAERLHLYQPMPRTACEEKLVIKEIHGGRRLLQQHARLQPLPEKAGRPGEPFRVVFNVRALVGQLQVDGVVKTSPSKARRLQRRIDVVWGGHHR